MTPDERNTYAVQLMREALHNLDILDMADGDKTGSLAAMWLQHAIDTAESKRPPPADDTSQWENLSKSSFIEIAND